MNDSERKLLREYLNLKNHKVLIAVDEVPSVGKAVTEYMSGVLVGITTVTNARYGITYHLANGARLIFTRNVPENTSRYSLVIDERIKKEEKENELDKQAE